MNDQQYMQRALALARRGLGKTSPNPCVGAVLVRNGKVLGEGWHRQAGGPHAEVFALQKGNARGATLYVTLEPCCTHGRTPPCTDAIIAAGVQRVVVAASDPNPKHNGRGLAVLKKAGIKVEAGLLADEATRLNESFNKWITTGYPLVIAKAALTLDGKIATRTGDSKWITSEAARRVAHQLRARVDAVMVGAGTVIEDNPSLTLRHGVTGRQPVRIAVDTRGRSPLKSHLFNDAHKSKTIVVTGLQSSPEWRAKLEAKGVTVLLLKARGSHVGMPAMLRAVGKLNITSVLVEGGGGLLGALFEDELVDKVAFFFAPKIIGGMESRVPIEGRGARTMREALNLKGRWRRIGDDEMLFEGDCR